MNMPNGKNDENYSIQLIFNWNISLASSINIKQWIYANLLMKSIAMENQLFVVPPFSFVITIVLFNKTGILISIFPSVSFSKLLNTISLILFLFRFIVPSFHRSIALSLSSTFTIIIDILKPHRFKIFLN